MTFLPPRTRVMVPAHDHQDVPLFACPMCHTPAPLALAAIDAGADWRCGRCGQRWNAARIAAVTAYAAWVVDRAAGERHQFSPDTTSDRLGRVR